VNTLECFNCGKDVLDPDVVFERDIRDRFGRVTVKDTICGKCKAKAEALEPLQVSDSPA
jgi:hypothetical protein